ncbi:TonB-dependent receptor plug [Alcanivorax sp. S71-1-4]|nr:TonB-dependent receptor plug [Alcanivorax sp. S71-1-4]
MNQLLFRQPLAGLLFCILAVPVFAEPEAETGPEEGVVSPQGAAFLRQVEVRAQRESTAPTEKEGNWLINRRQLDRYGQGSGQITPVLSSIPNVQFDEERFDDDSLVDLRPPSVSIAGGRIYENNFTLDGFSVNSRFDPGKGSGLGSEPPRQDQGLFLDLDLIDSVEVWQSNVPAEYGRFLGGVVNMETRRHGATPETYLSARRTQGDWVKSRVFQLPPEPGVERAPVGEPDFRRSRYTVRHSRPISDTAGIVAAFALAESSTPLLVVNQTEQQTQRNLNLFLKHSQAFFNGLESDTSLIWAPFEQTGYLPTYLDSEYQFTGGGLSLGNKLRFVTNRARKVQFDTNLSTRESNREGPRDGFSWAVTASKPWGANVETGLSHIGGTGSLERFEQSASSKLKISEPARTFSGSVMQVSYGTEAIYSQVGYERPSTSRQYSSALKNPDIDCRGSVVDCVDNEQYFTRRRVYEADNVDVTLLEAGLFSEMSFAWPRFEATFGLRGDYNDYTRNVDIAPRSRFSVDLAGDRRSLLVFGANRYYGGSLITYRLREARRPAYGESRGATQNIVNDWERAAQQSEEIYRSNDLKTPYSDELTIGLRQHFLGGVASIDLLQRRNRDQFSSETTDILQDGFRVIMLNNDGHSEYESVSLGWDRSWSTGTHAGITLTWSESSSTNESYDDSLGDVSTSPYVWYRGQRMRSSAVEVLRQNFARPLVGNFRISQDLAKTLQVGVVLEYLGSHDNVIETGNITITGPDGQPEILPVLTDTNTPRRILANANIKWTPWPRHRFSLLLDVENIANARTYSVPVGARGVEIGRRFWLGMDYAF